MVVGDPIYVPADADDDMMEAKRREITRAIEASKPRGVAPRRRAGRCHRAWRIGPREAGHGRGREGEMTDIFSRAALGAYRLAGSLAYPVVGPYVGYRVSKGKEDPRRRRERYGYASAERPQHGSLVWLHAASVGESMAVAPLAEAIAADGIAVLMTTGTITSAAIVAERLDGVVIHQYVPIDMLKCVRRFLDHWRPDLSIVAESEIWPMTMVELQRRQVPQVLVNARLSDKSFKGWKSAPQIAESLFERFRPRRRPVGGWTASASVCSAPMA